MRLINLKNISKDFGSKEGKIKAINNISLTINEGELIAIVGPSGSGKSTLMNIIGFIDTPSTGEYFLNGESILNFNENDLAKMRNTFIGFVLQYFGLIPSYTVYENIELPLIYAKHKNKKEKILSMLKKLNLLEKQEKLPSELSGGQNQRVAIGRALINNPKLILADEPTGALDKKSSKEIINILLNLNKEGKTVIIITHDENIANQCNRLIRMEDGVIIEDKNINAFNSKE